MNKCRKLYEAYCGWLRNPASPSMVETVLKNGINHWCPLTSTGTGFLPSTVKKKQTIRYTWSSLTKMNKLEMWCWLVVWTPLKNISQLGWLFPIYGKIKNVPNHQPVMRCCKKSRSQSPWLVRHCPDENSTAVGIVPAEATVTISAELDTLRQRHKAMAAMENGWKWIEHLAHLNRGFSYIRLYLPIFTWSKDMNFPMFSPQFSEAFNPRNGAAHGIIDLKPSSDWWPHRVAHPAAAFCGIDLGPAAPLSVTGTAGLPLPLGKAYVVLRLVGDMIYCGSELLCTAI